MSNGIDRATLAKVFPNNPRAIVEFERLMATNAATPTTIEEAAATAQGAMAAAVQAIETADQLGEELARLRASVEAHEPPSDDYTPAHEPYQPARSAIGAAATDLASVIALTNSLRLALLDNQFGT